MRMTHLPHLPLNSASSPALGPPLGRLTRAFPTYSGRDAAGGVRCMAAWAPGWGRAEYHVPRAHGSHVGRKEPFG